MTQLQFTLTIQIDGDNAADIADDLGIDAEGGLFDLPLLTLFRQHLAAMRDTRDYRIVRATLTPAQRHEQDAVIATAVWQHKITGTIYIVELSGGHVVNAVGPVCYADLAPMLESGDWTGDPEEAAYIDAHAGNYRQLDAADLVAKGLVQP